MTRKEIILKVLKEKLGSIRENAMRAKLDFKGLSSEEMDEEHIQSGKSRREILDDYEHYIEKLNDAISWININTL